MLENITQKQIEKEAELFRKEFKLPGIDNVTAIVLGNLRLLAKLNNDNNDDYIALAQDIFADDFIGPDLVSFQPMLGPASAIYYQDSKGQLVSEDVSAKTRKFKAHAMPNNMETFEKREIIKLVAKELQAEITREIAADLRNNAGTKGEVESLDDIKDNINELNSLIHAKTNSHATWIYCNPDMANAYLGTNLKFDSNLNITFLGSSNGLKIYIDPLAPNTLVLGHKGNLKPIYHYCPYIMATRTPNVDLGDGACYRPSIMCRYAKKLPRGGSNYYATLKLALPKEQNDN